MVQVHKQESINLDEGFGRKELKKIIRRLNALHKERFKRLEGDLIQIQKDFLSLLPLLFHINHRSLFGQSNLLLSCLDHFKLFPHLSISLSSYAIEAAHI